MTTLTKLLAALSVILLVACAQQPTNKTTVQPKTTAAAKSTPSNVQISQNAQTNSGIEGSSYVQNRVLASGGVVSGALMGS